MSLQLMLQGFGQAFHRELRRMIRREKRKITRHYYSF
jgi:hypothetical protein